MRYIFFPYKKLFRYNILAFCPNFLCDAQNSCVLGEIIAPFKILAFQRKFLRPWKFLHFAQISCVMLKILTFLPIPCVCEKLSQTLLRSDRDTCAAKIHCVLAKILVLWEFFVLLTKILARGRFLAFLYVISHLIRRFHSSLMRPPHASWMLAQFQILFRLIACNRWLAEGAEVLSSLWWSVFLLDRVSGQFYRSIDDRYS